MKNVNYGQKSFITLVQCYKTFYVGDLRIFVLNYSLFVRLDLEKHCQGQTLQLIIKNVNYEQKKFYNIGPRTTKNKANDDFIFNWIY